MRRPSTARRRKVSLSMNTRKRTVLTIDLACAMTICVVCAVFVGRWSAVAKETYENIEIFTNVLALVQKNYVDPVSTKQLIDGAITGMLAALDPPSAYPPP